MGNVGNIKLNIMDVDELYLLKKSLSKKEDAHSRSHDYDTKLLEDSISYIKAGIEEQPCSNDEDED
ncbi:MAG: hypothetical protein WC376_04160 [Candidatus Nanoarchaeia archaeon]|jgi:hypothetical protein